MDVTQVQNFRAVTVLNKQNPLTLALYSLLTVWVHQPQISCLHPTSVSYRNEALDMTQQPASLYRSTLSIVVTIVAQYRKVILCSEKCFVW